MVRIIDGYKKSCNFFRRISLSTPSIPPATFPKATKINVGKYAFGLALCNSTLKMNISAKLHFDNIDNAKLSNCCRH